MHISALYLLCDPQYTEPVKKEISVAEDLDLQAEEGTRMIITMEAPDEASAKSRLVELESLPGVMGLQVTGFYAEPE